MNIWIEPVRSLVLRKTPHNKVNSYVYTITCTFPQCFGQYIPSQSKLLYNSSLRLPALSSFVLYNALQHKVFSWVHRLICRLHQELLGLLKVIMCYQLCEGF